MAPQFQMVIMMGVGFASHVGEGGKQGHHHNRFKVFTNGGNTYHDNG
jgi:hypothetical protein